MKLALQLSSCVFLLSGSLMAEFTVNDWHKVGVYAPDPDVPWGVEGYHSLAIDKGGNLIVAGGFSSLAGQAVKGVSKWNGTSWQALGAGLADPNVWQLRCMVSDGINLFVAGQFTLPGDSSISGRHLAWWDGHTWRYDLHEGETTGFRPADIRLLVAGDGVIYAAVNFRLSNDYSDIAVCIASWSPILGWRKLGQ